MWLLIREFSGKHKRDDFCRDRSVNYGKKRKAGMEAFITEAAGIDQQDFSHPDNGSLMGMAKEQPEPSAPGPFCEARSDPISHDSDPRG